MKDLTKQRVAVSGIAGSFSEEAGLIYAGRDHIDPEFVFATDMHGVLQAIHDGTAEVGVFPVVNSRGGLVHSAFKAMGEFTFQMKDEIWLEVHQCLLAQTSLDKSEIKKVVSHPQAIAQCERYLRRELPHAELVHWDDTAKAAQDLAVGKFDEHTAVIAPARSAHIYGLDIIQKGIHDNHPNLTTFIVVTK